MITKQHRTQLSHSVVCLVTLYIVSVAVVHATPTSKNLFVAQNGTDNESCGVTLETACETLGYAISMAADDDTIFVGDGHHLTDAKCVITQARLTIRGFAAGTTIECGMFPLKVFAKSVTLQDLRFSGRMKTSSCIQVSKPIQPNLEIAQQQLQQQRQQAQEQLLQQNKQQHKQQQVLQGPQTPRTEDIVQLNVRHCVFEELLADAGTAHIFLVPTVRVLGTYVIVNIDRSQFRAIEPAIAKVHSLVVYNTLFTRVCLNTELCVRLEANYKADQTQWTFENVTIDDVRVGGLESLFDFHSFPVSPSSILIHAKNLTVTGSNVENIFSVPTTDNTTVLVENSVFAKLRPDYIFSLQDTNATKENAQSVVSSVVFTGTTIAESFAQSCLLFNTSTPLFLRINDCTFVDNNVDEKEGGVIAIERTGGQTLVDECKFDMTEGRSIHVTQPVVEGNTTMIEACSFTNNTGAATIDISSVNNVFHNVRIVSCFFEENIGTEAATIRIGPAQMNWTIHGCTFHNDLFNGHGSKGEIHCWSNDAKHINYIHFTGSNSFTSNDGVELRPYQSRFEDGCKVECFREDIDNVCEYSSPLDTSEWWLVMVGVFGIIVLGLCLSAIALMCYIQGRSSKRYRYQDFERNNNSDNEETNKFIDGNKPLQDVIDESSASEIDDPGFYR